MAASLTADVINYFNSRGSEVYACALDAEGAFDSIPHAVIFKKTLGVIPKPLWRILVYWYDRLVVTIRWNNRLSDKLKIHKGTRQGGLSSPFLFNVVYQDMIQGLSDLNCGLKVKDMSFNCFCYADDILLTSSSTVGLQKLINFADTYIHSVGLKFNPTKTECIVFGKPKCNYDFFLKDTKLKMVNKIVYLGVSLSNTSGQDHCVARVNSARRAFYGLQGAGLCSKTVSPDISVHTLKVAIRPVLLYGCECIHMTKTALKELDKCQAKIVKSVCGLKSSCRNTPLLKALQVNSISSSVESQSINLLKSMLISTSMSRKFYTHILSQHISGSHRGSSLLSRVASMCKSYGSSLVSALCNNVTFNSIVRETKGFTPRDGLSDSVQALLCSPRSQTNLNLLNLLLRSY